MLKTYAAYCLNECIRIQSSSGGIFSLFAEYILQANGVIYGVVMSEDCYSAEYIRVQNPEDICKLRGSKYIQAKLGNTFCNIKKDLENGLFVLFSGTGCQVNGLKSFLCKEYDNLVCVDVVCHGTPSPKFWKIYALYQESRYGKLKNVNFRCKEQNGKCLGRQENRLYIPKSRDPFMNIFLDDFCLRPSCYECHAKENKLSDISIADFWGIENVAPEMSDGRGTSLVIVRTVKGQQLFETIQGNIKWQEVCYDDAVRENPAEYRSVERPPQRNSFFADLEIEPFENMIVKYVSNTQPILLRRIARKVKKMVKEYLHVNGRQRKANSDYGLLLTFQNNDE